MKQQTLNEAWADYRLHSESMGIKHNTLRGRESSARILLRDYGHKKLHTISDQHLAQFFLKAGETRGPRALLTTHSILKAFYKWCVATGRLKPEQNRMFTRRAPKVQSNREMIRIPILQWPALLDYAELSDPRDRLIVALGLYTLLRDTEMSMLRVRDVMLAEGHIRASMPKTLDTDLVAIPEDLDYEIRRWYGHYQHKVGQIDPDMFLIPAIRRNGIKGADGRWHRHTQTYAPYSQCGPLAKVLTPLYADLGYETRDKEGNSTNMGAHTLRRSGARAYYDYFVSIGRADALRVVQTMLHHSSAQMTQHYIGLHEDRQTRDQLVRGVTIFGLHQQHNQPQIGSMVPALEGATHGDSAEHHPIL